MRREYSARPLNEAEVDRDPMKQFDIWFRDAIAAESLDPNAMALATTDSEGRPSARVVLLKGFDDRGFVFFTNYESRKGRDLAENPHASLCFWWGELVRQVRIDGVVERVAAKESDAYFESRPIDSKLGAWASDQSCAVASREALERRMEEVRARYAGSDVPRPAHWGGYRLIPDAIEFWQGRPNRLHDRLYFRLVDGVWTLNRLAP